MENRDLCNNYSNQHEMKLIQEARDYGEQRPLRQRGG